MPRYAPKMDPNAFKQIFIDLAVKHDYVEEYGEINTLNPDLERMIVMLDEKELLTTAISDWSKIDFDRENMYVQGLKTTQDGIPYLELIMGGDWETPVFGILYFDGKKIRGFIPKSGNTYNHKTKKAFGNDDEDADLIQAQKQFGPVEDVYDLGYDKAQVTQEINTRLQAKGTYTPAQKKVISKAKVKAKKQAEIEKEQDLSGDITCDMVYADIHLAAGGSYFSFKLKSSGRTLTIDESDRVVGVPKQMEKADRKFYHDTGLWYSPQGCYPAQTCKILESAGFEKDPDCYIPDTPGVKIIYI